MALNNEEFIEIEKVRNLVENVFLGIGSICFRTYTGCLSICIDLNKEDHPYSHNLYREHAFALFKKKFGNKFYKVTDRRTFHVWLNTWINLLLPKNRIINFYKKWVSYMDERQADYEYRCRTRYKVVAERLFLNGLNNKDLLLDIGAGSTQLCHYLSSEGWRGRYLPVDAVLDGTNLDIWQPQVVADYIVCVEVLEHLLYPKRMINLIEQYTKTCAIVTVPNPAVVDVIACDPTHISIVRPEDFGDQWQVDYVSCFGVENDTLVATYISPELIKALLYGET